MCQFGYVFIGTFEYNFYAWNICPRKITPHHGITFLAPCLEGQIFHTWKFHIKVPMNTSYGGFLHPRNPEP